MIGAIKIKRRIATMKWIILAFLLLETTAIADQIQIVAPASILRYRVLEFRILHSQSRFSNPWEGPQLSIVFISPSNRTYNIGGFYYSENEWRIRFSPDEIGKWRWNLQWEGSGEVHQANGSFQSQTSSERGFIRHHPTNPYRFVYSTGGLYSAVGIGDCIVDLDQSGTPHDDWGIDGGFRSGHDLGSTTNLNTYASTYAAAGFNLFRWSVSNCSFRLWDKIGGKENRYLEQQGIWGDQLVQTMRVKGIRVFMTIFGFNPPATNSSDPQHLEAVRKYVAYVVNRYGAYVDFWELMNESPARGQTIDRNWYNSIGDYLRKIDPYDHPISTSFPRPDLNVIDINSPHWYIKESELQSDRIMASRIREERQFGKPVIFGEHGNLYRNWDAKSALRMRIRSWTAFFEEAILIFWNTSFAKDYQSGGAANIYLGPEERRYMRILQNFTKSAGPAAERVSIDTSAGVRAYGLQSPNVFLGYFHHFTSHQTPVVSTLKVNFPSPASGVWIDPATGATRGSVSIGAGNQIIGTPSFNTDLALRLRFLR